MAQVPLNRLISLPTLAFMTLPFATDTTTAQSPVNEPMYVYVGKNGSNASACIQSADSPCTSMIGPVCFAVEKPCLTIQGAIGKVPYEKRGSVFISPGTYSESVNVVGDLHHRVEIYGPYSFEGGNYRCVDPSQVVIAAPGDTAIWAQDHATVIVGCLTLGPANVGVAARQFVILDVAETRFDNVATSIVLSERSMATCGSRIWVTSSGSYVASVHRSDLNYACQTIIAAGLSFTAFFNADRVEPDIFRSIRALLVATHCGPRLRSVECFVGSPSDSLNAILAGCELGQITFTDEATAVCNSFTRQGGRTGSLDSSWVP